MKLFFWEDLILLSGDIPSSKSKNNPKTEDTYLNLGSPTAQTLLENSTLPLYQYEWICVHGHMKTGVSQNHQEKKTAFYEIFTACCNRRVNIEIKYCFCKLVMFFKKRYNVGYKYNFRDSSQMQLTL